MAKDKNQNVSQILNEQDTQTRNQYYNQYVKDKTPKFSCAKNSLKAYLIGGLICVLGQGITKYISSRGVDLETAKAYTSMILILLAVLSTGFGWYPKLAKFGGAGTLVPITGFANSVASPAVEYKKEGHVYGIGCKIFTIAGPVILYGIFVSWVLGLIYYILKVTNIV